METRSSRRAKLATRGSCGSDSVGDGVTAAAREAAPSALESAGAPPRAEVAAAPSAPSRAPSAATSRSSATVVARQLAARVEHARRLADSERRVANLQLQAERRAADLQLQADRRVADLQLQAELAAIEADSTSRHGSCKTRSRASVQDWVDNVPNPILDANPPFKNDFRASQYMSPSLPPVEQSGVGALRAPNTVEDTRFPTDANRPLEDGGVTRLVNSLDVLVNKINFQPRGSKLELPSFDGSSHLDWLNFRRVYDYTAESFSEVENLARLSCALRGEARACVAALLVAARAPGAVLDALAARFGRPEAVVLREVAAVRALPKVSPEGKDLTVFASRVRNCVEVIRLLNQDDYLRSPELFQALWSKLPALLRTRWLDYADSRNDNRISKIEMLANFLSREVDLQYKFGAVSDFSAVTHSSDHKRFRDRANSVVVIEKDHASTSQPSLENISNLNNCSLCKQSHELSKCEKFSRLTLHDRWQFIKNNKICHKCLRPGWHRYKTSCIKKVCNVEGCNMRHHILLHGYNSERAVATHIDAEDDESALPTSREPAPTPAAPTAPAQQPDEVLSHAATSGTCVKGSREFLRPLLKIVAVTVSGPAGSVDTYALLDDGSTATFIDSEISSRIGASGPEKNIHLDCVGGLGKNTKIQYVNINIKGRHSFESYEIKNARSISGLSAARQCLRRDSMGKYPYLADIADQFCYDDVKPMIIIGIDNWHLTFAKASRTAGKTQPAAILTALGWVLFGFSSSITKPVEVVSHASFDEPNNDQFSIERLIREQYKIDSIGISKKLSRCADDERAVQLLEHTAQRLSSGHFEVGLLWKTDKPTIPDSRQLALSRFLCLEKKMSKDPNYAQKYRQNIHDMLSKGYAEPCPAYHDNANPIWYLPHFGVVNENKPNKLRVVHDAAAKSHGVSLNSLLLTGPDLLQPLLGILMRFREGKIALTADIREMFPQVKIIGKDRDAQRFLWRDFPNEPIRTYRMSSMIFGAASSPFTALYIKNKNAVEWQERHPRVAHVIIADHYMDDCITSLDGDADAAQLASDIYTVHKMGGFEMRGWVSNEASALSLLPKEILLETHAPKNTLNVDLGRLAAPVRTLGLIWEPAHDSIGFNTGVKKEFVMPNKLTKREVLAHVMRVYDPLGILAPIVVRGRIMFQQSWRKGLEWDEELSQSECDAWKLWLQDLFVVSNMRIPRRYNLSELELESCELHIFCDASESAFAAVAYWRFIYVTGDVRLALICSKVRVAPLNPVSIPRLELQGALVAARLANSICEAHRSKPTRRVFWCDSMTALGWLRSDARSLKPFVSHRVGEILELSDINEWHWVPSELNVADDATRVKRATFSPESRWIAGPAFLLSSDWPTEMPIDVSGLGREEYKHTVHLIIDNLTPTPLSANPNRFSSWLRMVRATAIAHKFISLLRMRSLQKRGINFALTRFEGRLCTYQLTCASSPLTPPNPFITITANDIRLAETHILRQSQLDSFSDDIAHIKNHDPLPRNSRLRKLSPFIDDDNQLRMASRITATANVPEQMIRPLILDGKHPAIRLLILKYHQKAAHRNYEMVVNNLRQRFWLLGLRNAVRSVAHNCQFCKISRAAAFDPPMGNLPEARLAHHKRPFSFVGLDYFGPIWVTIGRRREKRYVALYTCLVVRAVHLEVVNNLSTDAAIMSLRRFIARRGTPEEIWSDNGTAFVGASRELRVLYSDAIVEFAANEIINWRFIPPGAPFMGGAWERLVRSIKEALKATLNERAPTEDVLSTLLLEAEALVNNRPLTHVSLEVDSEEALTPAHFLLGSSPGRPIPASVEDSDLVSRSRWRRALRLTDHFWRRWIKEYLPMLAPRRGGGATPVLALDDVVLICDSNLPRGSWPKGRITAMYPGADGVVRVADVATKAGILRRPLKKLVKI